MSFKSNEAIAELVTMLAYCRPDGSKAEKRFIREYISTLDVRVDAAGNLYKQVGESNVLWSSHTDTVHWQGGKQKVHISAEGIVTLDDKRSSCLGADCTTGVWLMRQMIKAGVPGLYIFHRAEEIGAHGSNHIANKTPELIDRCRYAIAFDRKGYSDVITHQGGRCCSDLFANSLADELNRNGPLMSYRKDDTGMFTDTANYTDIIGECTNISVGYFMQHSKKESQDLVFAETLLASLLQFDESNLVESRKAGELERFVPRKSSKGKSFDKLGYSLFDDSFESNVTLYDSGKVSKQTPMTPTFDFEQLCSEYPDMAAKYLEDMGVTAEDFASYIYDMTGHVRFN
jgi:hypothetical protein